MITIKNKAKTMVKHILCHYKCKFSSATCNSNPKWNHKTCQYEYKSYRTFKKDYSCSPSTYICEISKYLKSIPDTSVIACGEFIYVVDIASTKVTNTIAATYVNKLS